MADVKTELAHARELLAHHPIGGKTKLKHEDQDEVLKMFVEAGLSTLAQFVQEMDMYVFEDFLVNDIYG